MLKSKILLSLLPPFWPKMPPIGLGFLQSFLRNNDINADILDLNNDFYNLSDKTLKQQWLISCNVNLENNLLDIIKNNHADKFKAVIEQMLEYDIIGFSCFKSNFKVTLEIIRLLKSKKSNIKIILGGPEITRQFIKGENKLQEQIRQISDLLVVGEGEKALYEYLINRKNGKICAFRELKNLGNLAFPRYHGLNFNSYPRSDAYPIQFSRGCIKACNFCAERLLYKGFRTRPVKEVINEIQYHKKNNNIKYFVFFDSLLNGDLQKLEDLCQAIIEEFGLINWEAQIAIRNDMSIQLMQKLKRSGCYNLFIGLESGRQLDLQPAYACRRQHHSIQPLPLDLSYPRRHVAADRHDFDLGNSAKLRRSAGTARSQPEAGRDVIQIDQLSGHQYVMHDLTTRHRRDHQPGRDRRLQVLVAVDGEIDLVTRQSLLDRPHESAHRPIRVKELLRGRVPMRLDDDLVNLQPGMSFAQAITYPSRLPQGQITTAGPSA